MEKLWEVLKEHSKDRRFIALTVALTAIMIVIVSSLAWNRGSAEVPQSFIKAREDAALVSKKIVELTSATNESIKAASELEIQGKEDQAASIIQEARESNREAYENAFELSRHLQKMAESLAFIGSRKGQSLAYGAVAVELSLVSEFISYTQNLNSFFDSLALALSSDSLEGRKDIETHLAAVNESTNTINNLNEEFLAKIGQFDRSF